MPKTSSISPVVLIQYGRLSDGRTYDDIAYSTLAGRRVVKVAYFRVGDLL